MKYYYIFLGICATVFLTIYFFIPKDNKEVTSDNAIISQEKENPEIEQVELMEINENLENELIAIAKGFVLAYGNYDINAPTHYVESIKPYVIDKIYQQHLASPKREPMNVLKYSILEDKSSFSLVKQTKSEIETIKSSYTVIAQIVRSTKTTEKTYEEDIQYTLELKLRDEKWLINEVNIEDGKQYKSLTEAS